MSEIYTVRNVSEKARKTIDQYAREYDITIANALEQLVEFGIEYEEQHRKSPKKYITSKDAMKTLPEW